MKKLAIADYESASDLGNMRYYPKGKLIKSLIEQYVTKKVVEYGAMEVETPIMYDSTHPSMVSYFNRFPARQYNINSDNKKLFLRFADLLWTVFNGQRLPYIIQKSAIEAL